VVVVVVTMQIRRKVGGCAAALALCIAAGCHPATGQAGAIGCAPPPPWLPPGARPGHPDAEFAACLKDKAYEARSVAVPVESKAPGIIAQCQVEVDRFEGSTSFGDTGSDEERDAADRRAMRQATAAVLAYQSCAGR